MSDERRSSLLSALIPLLLSAPGVSAQCHYDATIIQGPTHPVYGPPVTIATGLNNLGHVVGYYEYLGDDERGFLWTPENGFQTLPMPAGAVALYANDINDFGTIVGTAEVSNPGGYRGFVYENGEYTYLPPRPGGAWSAALAINNSGNVVGYRSIGEGVNPFNACVWNDGNFTDLGVMRGPNSSAIDINDDGMIAGWTGSNQVNSVAFRRIDGLVELLPTLVLRTSYATAISSTGTVVGSLQVYVNGGPETLNRGFAWTDDEVALLMPLPGYDRSAAGGVDGDGNTAGVSSLSSNPNDRRATLWFGASASDLDELGPASDGVSVRVVSNANNAGAFAAYGSSSDSATVGIRLWPTPCPIGDIDRDGDVDLADLSLLLSSFGCSVDPCLGDFDENGRTDLADLAAPCCYPHFSAFRSR